MLWKILPYLGSGRLCTPKILNYPKKKKKSHALHKLPTRIYDDQDQLQLND